MELQKNKRKKYDFYQPMTSADSLASMLIGFPGNGNDVTASVCDLTLLYSSGARTFYDIQQCGYVESISME